MKVFFENESQSPRIEYVTLLRLHLTSVQEPPILKFLVSLFSTPYKTTTSARPLYFISLFHLLIQSKIFLLK